MSADPVLLVMQWAETTPTDLDILCNLLPSLGRHGDYVPDQSSGVKACQCSHTSTPP